MNIREAIEIIEDFKAMDDWTIVYCPPMHEALDVVVTEALRKQKVTWIQCSERLPDKGLRVLMQLDNAWQIVGWYDKEDKQWYALPFSQEVVNDCVLAWMPIPKYDGKER